MPTKITRKPTPIKRKPVHPVRRKAVARKPHYHLTPAEEYEERYAVPERIARMMRAFTAFAIANVVIVLGWLMSMVVYRSSDHPDIVDMLFVAAFGANYLLYRFLLSKVRE